MPRGQKSKLRAREKRQQARAEIQNIIGAVDNAAEDDQPSSTPAAFKDTDSSCPIVGVSEQLEEDKGACFIDLDIPSARAIVSANRQEEDQPRTSQAALCMASNRKDPLIRKTCMVVQFLLEKYKMKEPITRNALLKIVSKKYKDNFPEILRRVSERMELVFGLELREMEPSGHYYTLVSKLGFMSDEGHMSGDEGLPKMGLLMTLLGVIFMKGNRATEEEIWDFLSMLGIYAGRRHLIFGEPRKLITQDFVREKYLEYQLVPHSDPPFYEFSWGPRAHAETTKMKVLDILAKINDTTPASFPDLYEEALRDEEERARARAINRAASAAKASEHSKVKSKSPSNK
ncbi:melanoma-associated antigen B4-like [Suncus etruscus]|uniref:melanoma-associated antigen B4-like n=1 Tax=Suncus etruscus TaxID=109475 RepID=UPI00210FC456|nr:melanoma-associated antigen B4-like [Suncus etruscus]